MCRGAMRVQLHRFAVEAVRQLDRKADKVLRRIATINAWIVRGSMDGECQRGELSGCWKRPAEGEDGAHSKTCSLGPSMSSSGSVVDFSAHDACRCGHALGWTKRQRPYVLGGGVLGKAGRALCCNPRPSPPSSFPLGPVGRYGAVVAWGAALLRVAGTASLEVV